MVNPQRVKLLAHLSHRQLRQGPAHAEQSRGATAAVDAWRQLEEMQYLSTAVVVILILIVIVIGGEASFSCAREEEEVAMVRCNWNKGRC